MASEKKIMRDIIIPQSKKNNEPKKVVSEPPLEPPQEIQKTTKGHTGSHRGLLLVTALALIALALGVGGVLAQVTLLIQPKQLSFDVDQVVSFSDKRVLSGIFFSTATDIFSEEAILSASETAQDSQPASGSVRVFNKGNEDVILPEGTLFDANNGVRYQLTTRTVIPPGTKDILVIATEVGPQGNQSETDFILKDTLSGGELLTFRSAGPISGGVLRGEKIVNQQDVAQEYVRLLTQLRAKEDDFRKQIAEKLPEDMIALPIFIAPTQIRTRYQDSDQGVRVIAEEAITVIVVSREDLAKYFTKNYPQIRFAVQNLDGINMTSLGPIDPMRIPDTIQVRMTGTLGVGGVFDRNMLKESIAGLKRNEIQKNLAAIPEIDSFKVKFRPFWRLKAPLDPDTVVILDTFSKF